MRALVISDVRFYREGIARALREEGLEAIVSDQASGGLGARAAEADVALVDLVDGALADSLAALGGRIPVVGLALSSNPSVAAAAALGVRAFVGCDQTLADLVQTTRQAARGEAVCPPSVAAALFAGMGRPEPPSPSGPIGALTAREREIARLVTRGLSNKEIATALVIEPATVKNHVHQILRKLAVQRRGQAAALLGAAWTERPIPEDRRARARGRSDLARIRSLRTMAGNVLAEETRGVQRPQVLLAEMPALIEDLLRGALAGSGFELLPAGSTPRALRRVGEDEPPPIVIVAAEEEAASRWERDLLVPHPQAVILRVEDDGRLLASRVVEVRRRPVPGDLTAASLVSAIEAAPPWRERFAT